MEHGWQHMVRATAHLVHTLIFWALVISYETFFRTVWLL
jgi:hypothetical protein